MESRKSEFNVPGSLERLFLSKRIYSNVNPKLELNDLIARRWSPRAFSEQPVDPESLRLLMEAARWAASSGNEQPWRFCITTKADPEAHASALHVLDEFNQLWAKNAPVIGFSFAKKTFSNIEGRLNKWFMHDTGLALGNLMLQATALGLYVHAMAGYNAERAIQTFGIPDDFEPVAAFAVGHLGDPSILPEKYQERERAPRVRKPLEEVVFSSQFGKPFGF